MANGIAELAPPNEGGDDRDPVILRQHYAELWATEYPVVDDTELRNFLYEAAKHETAEADAAQQSKNIPEQRKPAHDAVDDSQEFSRPQLVERVPEPVVFKPVLIAERGIARRYRQRAVGIHAGHLVLRRQRPVPIRKHQDGSTEYRLG